MRLRRVTKRTLYLNIPSLVEKRQTAFANVHINTVEMAIESGTGEMKTLTEASNNTKASLKVAVKRLRLQVNLAGTA